MKNKQILMIHGGMTFKNEKDYLFYLNNKEVSTVSAPYWEADLEKKLGSKFEVIRPRMPLADNAKYRDWKILFEKYVPLLRKDYILIGSSLGGIFLAKYLSENKMPRKALSVYIVCAPYDGDLPTEDLVGGFKLKNDLSVLEENCKNLYVMFSDDDDVVPVSHAEKYGKKLEKAKILIYKDRMGHFTAPKFQEIINLIRKDVKKT
jgi:predicted alpha/beta hydrolase family esterase